MIFFEWDYKDEPPWERINDAICDFRFPMLISLDTDGDQLGVAVATSGTTKNKAQEAYLRHLRAMENE